jgi:single-stranded DNA-binding protein
MNKVLLRGRIVKDFEVIAGKVPYAKFTLANNVRKDKTYFFNCIAFDKLGETMSIYCKKGQEILLEGELSENSVKGVTYYTIIVKNFEFIGQSKRTEKEDN